MSRKGGYVTVDFVVPESRWKGVPLREIERYLASGAKDAVRAMVERVQKAKIPVDAEGLCRDVDKAIDAFLSDHDG